MNPPSLHSSRRKLLKGGLASAIAWSTAPLFLSPRVLGRPGNIGPNSRINVGIVGNGLISDGHRGFCLTQPATQVVALCDVNRQNLDKAMAEAKAKGVTCDAYVDSREFCARPDIDAVFVTTPDHWHAAISIDAMRNGKDVYVEKPMTLTIEEGKAMRSAAERYGRIVQVGSQQRSNGSFRKAAELVLNGYIGKVDTIVCRLGEFPPPPSSRNSPSRRPSTTTAGSAPRLGSPTTPSGSRATTAAAGAGSGNTAPAKTATGARTISTSCNGRWAWMIPAPTLFVPERLRRRKIPIPHLCQRTESHPRRRQQGRDDPLHRRQGRDPRRPR